MTSIARVRLTARPALLCAVLLPCLILALPTGASAAKARKADHCPVAVVSSVAKAKVYKLNRTTICLINHRRALHGLRPLRARPRLSRAARRHTRDMVRHRYFDHVSRRGRSFVDRLRRTRYISGRSSWIVGENIAWGSGGRGTPRAIVAAWMHSSGHRRNILNPRFREIGIGIARGAPKKVGNAATYTTTFGARG